MAWPAAMASGFPDRVPAWYTPPNGARCSMISQRPPKAPTGRPPPITLPKHHRSGWTLNHSEAPPLARRNPLITSSKTSKAPAASQARRRPSRKPSAGATRPILAATGSTTTAATVSSSSGTTLYGATTVSATAPAVTPSQPEIPWSATPLPPAASSASAWPW